MAKKNWERFVHAFGLTTTNDKKTDRREAMYAEVTALYAEVEREIARVTDAGFSLDQLVEPGVGKRDNGDLVIPKIIGSIPQGLAEGRQSIEWLEQNTTSNTDAITLHETGLRNATTLRDVAKAASQAMFDAAEKEIATKRNEQKARLDRSAKVTLPAAAAVLERLVAEVKRETAAADAVTPLAARRDAWQRLRPPDLTEVLRPAETFAATAATLDAIERKTVPDLPFSPARTRFTLAARALRARERELTGQADFGKLRPLISGLQTDVDALDREVKAETARVGKLRAEIAGATAEVGQTIAAAEANRRTGTQAFLREPVANIRQAAQTAARTPGLESQAEALRQILAGADMETVKHLLKVATSIEGGAGERVQSVKLKIDALTDQRLKQRCTREVGALVRRLAALEGENDLTAAREAYAAVRAEAEALADRVASGGRAKGAKALVE